MTDYTPTTLVVKDAVTFPRERLGEPRPIKPEAFDRWLERTLQEARAEAWDEGASIMRDIYGDPMDPNPYRKEQDR